MSAILDTVGAGLETQFALHLISPWPNIGSIANRTAGLVETRHSIGYPDAIVDFLSWLETEYRQWIDESESDEERARCKKFLQQTLAIRRIDLPHNGNMIPAIEFHEAGIILSAGNMTPEEVSIDEIASPLANTMPTSGQWKVIFNAIPGKYERPENLDEYRRHQKYFVNIWGILGLRATDVRCMRYCHRSWDWGGTHVYNKEFGIPFWVNPSESKEHPPSILIIHTPEETYPDPEFRQAEGTVPRLLSEIRGMRQESVSSDRVFVRSIIPHP